MQVELIGCTGTGKTTLARRIIAAAPARGVCAQFGDQLALRHLGLGRLAPGLPRTLLFDLGLLTVGLATLPAHQSIDRLAIREIQALPPAVPVGQRLNLVRNVLKKSGLYEMIRRVDHDQTLTLVDEGTLHAAHNLFVHVSVKPNLRQLSTFTRMVSLPDVAICLASEPGILVRRTLARGHARIPSRTEADVRLFVNRALLTFSRLTAELQDLDRMISIQPEPLVLIRPDRRNDPLLPVLLGLLPSAIAAPPGERSTRAAPPGLGGPR